VVSRKFGKANLAHSHRRWQRFDDDVKTLSGMRWRKLPIESALLKACQSSGESAKPLASLLLAFNALTT
jgi:hypothetical protein